MNKKMSITCPHCGKLNPRTASNCINCGQPLPISNQPGRLVMQRQLKRYQRWALGGVICFFAIILLALVIKQNQPVLRTSSMTVTPFRVDFYNRHHRVVMVKYLRGGISRRHYGYARGTLYVSNHLKGKKEKAVYVDSRDKMMFVVDSHPRLTFYYSSRRGKFNDYGHCRVSDHSEIKTFRMTKLDSGN